MTIATNMAGRGTDILLGGNPAGLASEALHKRGLNPAEVDKATYATALAEAKAITADEHEEVVAAGGLHIIGTERHDSRRIDNQLRGRAGRQGDPGSSRFYLSLEDDLMKRFASERVTGLMERLGLDEDTAIESRLVSKTIESAQSRVEGFNFDMRKRVVEYDDVINKQRETIYAERDKVLHNEDLTETIRGFIDDEIDTLVASHLVGDDPHEWDIDGLANALEVMGVTGEGTSADELWELGTPRGHRRAPARARRRAAGRSRGRGRRRPTGRPSSGWSCCGPSTRCGWSTSPRSTTCVAASACAATPSRIRSTSSAARRSSCTRSSATSSGTASRARSSASPSPASRRPRRAAIRPSRRAWPQAPPPCRVGTGGRPQPAPPRRRSRRCAAAASRPAMPTAGAPGSAIVKGALPAAPQAVKTREQLGDAPVAPGAASGNGRAGSAGGPPAGFTPTGARIGRNDACWCGSGRQVQEVPRPLRR